MASRVIFVILALILIIGIAAFIYFVIWGMVLPWRVDPGADDQKARRRTMP